MKKLSFLLAIVLILSFSLTACAKPAEQATAETPAAETPAAEGDTIRIGVFEPITGANAGGGALEVEGIKLANKLYPEVLGKKLNLLLLITSQTR